MADEHQKDNTNEVEVIVQVKQSQKFNNDGEDLQTVDKIKVQEKFLNSRPLTLEVLSSFVKGYPLLFVRVLDFKGSFINNEGLQRLSILTNLTHLSLCDSRQFDDCDVSQCIKKLTNLTHLDLNNTKAGDLSIKAILTLTNIQRLFLSDTINVSSTGAALLGKCHTLQSLSLRNTNINDETITSWISDLTPQQGLHVLHTLVISFTSVTNSISNCIYLLPSLISLDLKATQVTHTGLSSLQKKFGEREDVIRVRLEPGNKLDIKRKWAPPILDEQKEDEGWGIVDIKKLIVKGDSSSNSNNINHNNNNGNNGSKMAKNFHSNALFAFDFEEMENNLPTANGNEDSAKKDHVTSISTSQPLGVSVSLKTDHLPIVSPFNFVTVINTEENDDEVEFNFDEEVSFEKTEIEQDTKDNFCYEGQHVKRIPNKEFHPPRKSPPKNEKSATKTNSGVKKSQIKSNKHRSPSPHPTPKTVTKPKQTATTPPKQRQTASKWDNEIGISKDVANLYKPKPEMSYSRQFMEIIQIAERSSRKGRRGKENKNKNNTTTNQEKPSTPKTPEVLVVIPKTPPELLLSPKLLLTPEQKARLLSKSPKLTHSNSNNDLLTNISTTENPFKSSPFKRSSSPRTPNTHENTTNISPSSKRSPRTPNFISPNSKSGSLSRMWKEIISVAESVSSTPNNTTNNNNNENNEKDEKEDNDTTDNEDDNNDDKKEIDEQQQNDDEIENTPSYRQDKDKDKDSTTNEDIATFNLDKSTSPKRVGIVFPKDWAKRKAQSTLKSSSKRRTKERTNKRRSPPQISPISSPYTSPVFRGTFRNHSSPNMLQNPQTPKISASKQFAHLIAESRATPSKKRLTRNTVHTPR